MNNINNMNKEFTNTLLAGKSSELIGSEGHIDLLNGERITAKNLLEVDIPVGTSVLVVRKKNKDYIYSADIKE